MSFDSNGLDSWLLRETVGPLYLVKTHNDLTDSGAAMSVDDRTDQPLHDRKHHWMRRNGAHQVFLHQDQPPAGGQRGVQENQVSLPRSLHRWDPLLCPHSGLLPLPVREIWPRAVALPALLL